MDSETDIDIELEIGGRPKRSLGIWRILLMGVGAFVATLAFVVCLAFWATSGIVDTADTFFDELRNNDQKAAYELGSSGFKESVDFAQFKVFVKKHNLQSFSSTNWTSRETSGFGNGATGSLEGSLVDDDGNADPIALSLVKQGGAWRIYEIDLEKSGVNVKTRGTDFDNSIPKERSLIVLVQASDAAFAEAVDEDSMALFHDHVSRKWANHHTVSQLDGFFADFLKKKPSLLALKNESPAFSTPAFIDDQGWLIVSGFYDTRPQRAEFTHKYVYEGFGWKLVGYSFELVSADAKYLTASETKEIK